MVPTRNTSLDDSPGQSPTPHLQQTRASLPPKPVSQKRTRNSNSAAGVHPASHAPQPGRPRRSWSRRSASWTPEEDAKLIDLVRKETSVPPSITASKTWSRVAAQLTKRTGKQCRERYLNQLKPGIRRDPWSPEEERILHEAHAHYGNKWVTIASQLPGRTDNCVKNHWNSMLRKRQRREAAMRAAQDGRTSKVRSVLRISADHDHKVEAEHSVYTGCATPSGASSSNHDVPTSSGVPSPFTASSPITPKRDVKLQISSLVATSSKEVPPWNAPYLTRKISPQTESPGHPSLGSGQAQMSNLPTGPQSILTRRHDHTKRHTRSTSASASNPNPVFQYHYNAEDAAPQPPPCSNPLEAHSVRTGTDGIVAADDAAGFRRQLRRSARLTSASLDKTKAGSSEGNSKPSGIKKRSTSKGRRHGEGVGNPLAALAAAASSVPPSPLTPESRFSGTSRSRSVSPCPRAIPDVGKANSGSGVSTVNLGTNALKRIGTTDSCQAEQLENSGNNSGKGTTGVEALEDSRKGERLEVELRKRCGDENRHGTETNNS